MCVSLCVFMFCLLSSALGHLRFGDRNRETGMIRLTSSSVVTDRSSIFRVGNGVETCVFVFWDGLELGTFLSFSELLAWRG